MSLRARVPIVLALATVLTLLAVPTALAARVTIRIGDRVDPATITIPPGTSVTFHNVDDHRHRLRTRAEPDFDTGDLEPGERATVTFRTPGRYPYVDERDRDDRRYHGTIVVRSSGSGDGETGGGTGDDRGSAGGGETAGGPVTVRMAGRAFSPAEITVAAGTRITFLNDDDDEHTATERVGSFDTGVLQPGASDTATLDAGTYRFLCAIHPEMTGRITVTGGSTSGGTPPATPRPTPAPTATPESPRPQSGTGDQLDATVSLVDFAFQPIIVELAAGGTLTARNDGAATHTLTAFDESVDSGFLRPGATYRTTFDSPGTFPFLCSLHPEMALEVRVLARSAGVAPSGPPAPAAPASTRPSAPPSPDASSASPPEAAAAVVPSSPAPVVTTGPAAGGRMLLVAILVGTALVAFAKVLGGTIRARRG